MPFPRRFGFRIPKELSESFFAKDSSSPSDRVTGLEKVFLIQKKGLCGDIRRHRHSASLYRNGSPLNTKRIAQNNLFPSSGKLKTW